MTPSAKDMERAREILAPLFNPEPHPFQEEWSDSHSMSSETLLNKLAQALADQRERLAKIIDEYDLLNHETIIKKPREYAEFIEQEFTAMRDNLSKSIREGE